MNSFRFCPELFECRSDLLIALSEAELQWFSHFSSIDLLHDVYGLEVCGIRDRDDAYQIMRILRRMFVDWHLGYVYEKTFGIEPGWVALLHRDPEPELEQWETA